MQELNEVATFWFTVGMFLKVSYSKLETIRKDQCDKNKECLREMLAVWLKEKEASPVALVQAVRAAGYVTLAKKIAVKHGKGALIL